MHGRALKIPAGYKGVVLSATEEVLLKKGGEEEEEEEEPDVKVMEEQSVFEEVMIWGHEAVMDESDPYVRGLEEWIGVAEQVCREGDAWLTRLMFVDSPVRFG